MDTRLAQIGIIVENRDAAAALNRTLGEYGDYIVGRMGLPIKERKVNVISLVVIAPQDTINTLTGKIGSIGGVSAKTLFSKV